MDELPPAGPPHALRSRPPPDPRSFSFSAGQVLSRSFRIFGTRCWILIPLSLVVHMGPLWALGDLDRVRLRAMGPFAWIYVLGTGRALASVLVDWALPLAFQAVVAYAVFQSLRGTPARWGSSIGRGLRRLPHALGASLLILAAMVVPAFLLGSLLARMRSHDGWALFVLLVYLVYLAWLGTRVYVGVQAAVVEGVGPVRAFRRSSFLTNYARWKVFGILIVVVVVPWILSNYVLPLWLLRRSSDADGNYEALLWAYTALNVVFAALQAVAAAVTYHALREAKEGIGLDELLAVFD